MLFAVAAANAGGKVALSDNQLDSVTAGSAIVYSNAAAQATGLITIATTGSGSALGSNTGVEDGFGSNGGVSIGTAVSYGTDGAAQGYPPATSTTSVTTGGSAQGNFVLDMSGGGQVTAGPLTIQAGFTSVYGVYVPGL
ncbi:MAG: hypothetical protein WB611_22015 [Stellaceae bacterium]